MIAFRLYVGEIGKQFPKRISDSKSGNAKQSISNKTYLVRPQPGGVTN